MAEKRKDETDGTCDAETSKFIEDSFNSLVGELERKGYSKEYATKIAGKVAAEKGMTGHHDSKDSTGAKPMAADASKTEVKDPEGKKEDPKKDGDLKVGEDRKKARDARDAKRHARDERRAKDSMSSEEEEAEDAAECAEDAEEEKEDEKDESKDAKDRRSARDRRGGARDARKHARDRARDRAKDSKKGMDAAEITALVDRKAKEAADAAAVAAFRNGSKDRAAADALYARASHITGAFDHAEMCHKDVAIYVAKALKLPESADPVGVVEGFLAGRGAQAEPRRAAQDSGSSPIDSLVDMYLAA